LKQTATITIGQADVHGSPNRYEAHRDHFRTSARFGALLLFAAAVWTVEIPAGAALNITGINAATNRAEHCLTGHQPVTTLPSVQPSRFRSVMQSRQAIDATTALWFHGGHWPVSLTGGSQACWYGGRVIGTFPSSTSWDAFHHTGGFSFRNPNFAVVGLRVHNYGDAIDIFSGADNFRISDVHLSFIHDDCIQNDELYSGVIESSLLDGCYVALSARPTAGRRTDGRSNTWTIRNSLIRLQPMPTVYRGRAPGHGGFFKWDTAGRAPKIIVRNTMFRADQRPNHQTLGLPVGTNVTCSNDTMVWLGKGRFPEHLPKCFRITTDRRIWDRAVARWNDAHPFNP